MEFADVVRKRKMVHRFEQRPVDPTLLDRLLDTARRAPSAGFSQGTDFLVLDTPQSRARFWELTENPQFPNDSDDLAAAPPVLVIAFSDPSRYVERYSRPDKIAFGLDKAQAWPVPFWDVDTSMACILLLLAAVDAGLGSWFFGIGYGADAMRAEFEVPDDRTLVGVVGLGYETHDPSPKGSAYSLKRRDLTDMVHRNGW